MHNIKFNQLCLVTLTLAMCVQRLTIAVGNILYALSIVFFAIDTYRRHRAGERIFVPARVRRYFLVYLFFALAVLPSAVFGLAPGYSFPKYVDYFVVRFLVLVMLLFLKIDGEAIKKALLCPARLYGRGWSGDACRAAHHAVGAGTWARRWLAAPCEHRRYGVSCQHRFMAFEENGHPA